MNKIKAPRFTLSQLRTFEAVARLGHVTRAAAELHMAQPTVSTQLKELTLAVGTPLLVPAGRGVQLTDAGAALARTATAMFAQWASFEETVGALQGLQRGVLRIAGVSTSEYFIAEMLKPFAQAHPGVQIDLAVENRNAVITRLQREQDDLAVMMMPPTSLPLEQLAFMDNHLVVIGAVDHPWALRKSTPSTPLATLKTQRLLLREEGSGTRRAAEQFFDSKDLQLPAHMSLGSNEALKHAVAAGLGVGVISRLALGKDPAGDGLAVLKVAGFPIKRSWQLVWRSDRVLPLAAQKFIAYVRLQIGERA